MNTFKIQPFEVDITQPFNYLDIPVGAELVEFVSYPPPLGKQFVWFKVPVIENTEVKNTFYVKVIKAGEVSSLEDAKCICSSMCRQVEGCQCGAKNRWVYLGTVAVMKRNLIELNSVNIEPVFLWGRWEK